MIKKRLVGEKPTNLKTKGKADFYVSSPESSNSGDLLKIDAFVKVNHLAKILLTILKAEGHYDLGLVTFCPCKPLLCFQGDRITLEPSENTLGLCF